MKDDLISRQWLDDAVPRTSVEYICRKNTVSTNPYEHKYHDKFIQFMDDPEISDFGRWQYSNGFNTALVAVKCDLDKVPSVQKEHTETHSCDCERTVTHEPQKMRGKWETIEGWDGDEVYRCSECGEEYVLIDGTPKENGYHFCPNCGAKMVESEVKNDVSKTERCDQQRTDTDYH